MAARAQSEPASALLYLAMTMLAIDLGVFCNEAQQLRKPHRLTVVEPYLQVFLASAFHFFS